MTSEPILDAMSLPNQCSVGTRIYKKTLAEHAANTPADRRLIDGAVEHLVWAATLRPTNIGVPAFRDDAREYLEIAVLTVISKVDAKNLSRVRELIHRAIPYPTLLVFTDGTLSAAHIRRSESDRAASVVDGDVHTATLIDGEPASSAFLASLPLAGLPNADLFTLYQAYIDRMTALAVARVTGAFAVVPPAVAERHRLSLAKLAEADADIARVRKNAESVSQMAKRVELNLELRALTARRAERISELSADEKR